MDSDMLNLEFPDLDASAPTQAGGDRPIKKYANKTFCWKKKRLLPVHPMMRSL